MIKACSLLWLLDIFLFCVAAASASKMAPSDKDGIALRAKPSIMEKQVRS